MAPLACFPDFDPAWIVEEDDDLVVIAKPWGVTSMSVDPSHPDDVVHRLGLHLSRRDGKAPRLGVHQRLDKETSGVMVLSKSERARKALARAFEGRTLGKEYVAVVTGWKDGDTTMRDRLTDPIDGRVRVVDPSDPRGKEAVSHVTVLDRRGDRALLGVAIETGRTHQIRVQLAHRGAAVAGDRLYGGAPSPRLLLHALSLTLPHPEGGERTYRTRVPAVFRRYLEGESAVRLDDPRSLEDGLVRAATARWGLAQASTDDRSTDAFRLVHGEGDGIPGLSVDVYGDYLVAHLYGDEAVAAEATLVEALGRLARPRGIHVKRRPKQANELVETRREDVAPSHALYGVDAPPELRIREHGVPYLVRLADGLSTGIFLDQRENRRRLLEIARDARVLNLFAYTGAFSCVAAAGGAKEIDTVDASAVALAQAEANYALGGYRAVHRTIHGDCFEVLDAFRAEKRLFDVVVCDPPTYSTTRKSRWTSGASWIDLAGRVLDVLAVGGTALLTSNDHRMTEDRFRRFVLDAARSRGLRPRIRAYLPPRDFPIPVGGIPHLKTLLVAI